MDSRVAWAIFLAWLFPFAVFAETWTGSAHVEDGDAINLRQTRIRLLDMDAFETNQNCERAGAKYACGQEATRAQIGLISQRPVRCEGDQKDRYGRALALCFVGSLDLGREMVRLGWAVAEFGRTYQREEDQARTARVGAWAGSFTRPKDWRRIPPR